MEFLNGIILDCRLFVFFGWFLLVKEVLFILEGICSGFVYVYSQNIVYFDLKLGNVFVLDDSIVRLLDFGLVVVLLVDMLDDGLVGGLMVFYVSLEMFEKVVWDLCDDVFVLGCIVYQILVGCYFFLLKVLNEVVWEGFMFELLEGLELKVWEVLVRVFVFWCEDWLEIVSFFWDVLFG